MSYETEDYIDQRAARVGYGLIGASNAIAGSERPLDRLSEIELRVGASAERINHFLGRFDPTPKPMSTTKEAFPPDAPGYQANITRILRQLGQLEEAVAQLERIG